MGEKQQVSSHGPGKRYVADLYWTSVVHQHHTVHRMDEIIYNIHVYNTRARDRPGGIVVREESEKMPPERRKTVNTLCTLITLSRAIVLNSASANKVYYRFMIGLAAAA